MKKYEHIDFKPPASVAKAAERGLEYRKKQKGDKAGLTPGEASKEGIGSGVQRAVNLKNRDTISPQVIRQMNRFFSRHQKNKAINPEYKGEPWKDKGYVSWLLWGGEAFKTRGVSGLSARNLRNYRQVALTWPRMVIRQTPSGESVPTFAVEIWQTPSANSRYLTRLPTEEQLTAWLAEERELLERARQSTGEDA